MVPYNFCTYFDAAYLAKGLALYRSLERWMPHFTLSICCLDDRCYAALASAELPRARLISLSQLEAADPVFAQTRCNRSRIEYYFTATPVLLLQTLQRATSGQLVTYLDADLYFFASPGPLIELLAGASCGLIEHRFPPHSEALKVHGIYNVGWVSLRNDEVGLACAEWWRRRCLERCPDRVEEGRFADQKYLEDLPQEFPGVRVLDHPGANLAPWNIERHRVRSCGGQILVDGQPIIFFHFHELRRISRRVHCARFLNLRKRPVDVVIEQLYKPYIEALSAEERRVAHALPTRASLGRGRGAYLSARDIASPFFAREVFRGRNVLFYNGRPLRRGGRMAKTTEHASVRD